MFALVSGEAVEKYPYTIRELRKDNPHTSFPRQPSSVLLAEFGVVEVQDTPRPEYDPITQDLTEGDPVLENGQWHRTWVVTDASHEEIERRQKALIPDSVTALQALLALDQAGLSGAYETWSQDPGRTFSQRAFIEKAQHWRRDDPTLAAAALDLGLSEEQLDQLFVAASQIN